MLMGKDGRHNGIKLLSVMGIYNHQWVQKLENGKVKWETGTCTLQIPAH